MEIYGGYHGSTILVRWLQSETEDALIEIIGSASHAKIIQNLWCLRQGIDFDVPIGWGDLGSNLRLWWFLLSQWWAGDIFWGRGQTMLFQGTDPEKDRKYLWCGSERTAREGAVKLLFPHWNMFSRSLTSSSSSSSSSPPHHLQHPQHPQHPQQFYGCFLCVSHISHHDSAAGFIASVPWGRICWPQSQSWDLRRSSSWMSGAKDDKIWQVAKRFCQRRDRFYRW